MDTESENAENIDNYDRKFGTLNLKRKGSPVKLQKSTVRVVAKTRDGFIVTESEEVPKNFRINREHSFPISDCYEHLPTFAQGLTFLVLPEKKNGLELLDRVPHTRPVEISDINRDRHPDLFFWSEPPGCKGAIGYVNVFVMYDPKDNQPVAIIRKVKERKPFTKLDEKTRGQFSDWAEETIKHIEKALAAGGVVKRFAIVTSGHWPNAPETERFHLQLANKLGYGECTHNKFIDSNRKMIMIQKCCIKQI